MMASKYALELKKARGLERALEIAEECKKLSETIIKVEDVPAFSGEIEFSMEAYRDKDGKEREREKIKIDKAAQFKRMTKTSFFWRNVVGVLKREKLKEEAKTKAS